MLIDTHCHLNFNRFDKDRDAVIARALEAGVEKMICIGCRVDDALKTLGIVDNYDNLFAAVAIHPADIEETSFEKDFDIIATLAKHEKVVAIGETGFDFFREENPSREIQKKSFRSHFELAKKLGKPLIIHSRAARDETLAFLKTLNGYPFVWHCFSEDMECAEQIVEIGGMISFTGIVTFKKSTEMQKVAENIPLENIMVETDAPFLAPVPHRGKRCEPAFTRDTAQFIADLREMSLEDFAAATTANAVPFFGL